MVILARVGETGPMELRMAEFPNQTLWERNGMEQTMEKKIIAGLATAFLLSAGAALAQSNASSTPSSNAGPSASTSTPADSAADKDAAMAKKARGTPAYPRAEARLNRAEAQETKELNIQESQEVAANNRGGGSPAANSMNSGAPDRDAATQPQ